MFCLTKYPQIQRLAELCRDLVPPALPRIQHFLMSEKQKILIVEDNDFVRMQIVRYLDESGFELTEAKDGDEALHLMDADVALAIVDVRMEPMGGLDFVRALRGKELDTPVIFVTGDQNTDLLEQASKWGVGAVLLKPVMKDRLVQAVERAMIMRGRR